MITGLVRVNKSELVTGLVGLRTKNSILALPRSLEDAEDESSFRWKRRRETRTVLELLCGLAKS